MGILSVSLFFLQYVRMKISTAYFYSVFYVLSNFKQSKRIICFNIIRILYVSLLLLKDTLIKLNTLYIEKVFYYALQIYAVNNYISLKFNKNHCLVIFENISIKLDTVYYYKVIHAPFNFKQYIIIYMPSIPEESLVDLSYVTRYSQSN